jgi:hypothetical protein
MPNGTRIFWRVNYTLPYRNNVYRYQALAESGMAESGRRSTHTQNDRVGLIVSGAHVSGVTMLNALAAYPCDTSYDLSFMQCDGRLMPRRSRIAGCAASIDKTSEGKVGKGADQAKWNITSYLSRIESNPPTRPVPTNRTCCKKMNMLATHGMRSASFRSVDSIP